MEEECDSHEDEVNPEPWTHSHVAGDVDQNQNTGNEDGHDEVTEPGDTVRRNLPRTPCDEQRDSGEDQRQQKEPDRNFVHCEIVS